LKIPGSTIVSKMLARISVAKSLRFFFNLFQLMVIKIGMIIKKASIPEIDCENHREEKANT